MYVCVVFECDVLSTVLLLDRVERETDGGEEGEGVVEVEVDVVEKGEGRRKGDGTKGILIEIC